ncbi:MAG: M23 family metallopeptidase [Myxococcota bacterium]
MGWAFVWLAWIGCRGFDNTAPFLEVRGPVGPVKVMAEFTIKVHDAQTAVRRLMVTVDDDRSEIITLPKGASPHELGWVLGLASLSQGPHMVRFTAFDDALVANTAEAEISIDVDRIPPDLELHRPSLQVGQGRTGVVWVRAKGEPLEKAVIRFGDDREPMFEVNGAFRSLRGVPIRAEVGPLPFVITAEDQAGNASRIEGALTVVETAFEEGGFIKLTAKQKRKRKDKAALREMRRERDEAYAVRTLEQRWREPFLLPVKDGEFTSPFGKFRTYSDGRKDHHTGLDLSKEQGAPILAPAEGRVLLAKPQAIFGNVVILDHGHGVTTSYNHLASIGVDVGDVVKRGQTIATLGSTGQSTGPHLHWSMVVGDDAVDPGQWLQEDFSTAPFR